MRAHAMPAGKGAVHEAALEVPSDHLHQGMMDDAVGKARRVDDSALGLVDLERAVRAGVPQAGLQAHPQAHEVALQIH